MGTLYLQPMGQKWLGILRTCESEGSPMEPLHLWSLSLTLTPHKQCQNGIIGHPAGVGQLLLERHTCSHWCSLSLPAAPQLAPLL